MNREAQKQRMQKRNAEIQEEYFNQKKKKKDNVQIYSNEFIIYRIAKQYFLAPATVEKIIFSKIIWLPKTQLEFTFQEQAQA